MATKKNIWYTIYKTIVPIFYGLGASVVIVGALFKILHLNGANLMLTVGLLLEAAIFVVSSFEHLAVPEEHIEWERVYPQLSDDYDGPAVVGSGGGAQLNAGAETVSGLNEMMKNAKIDQHLLDNLSKGLSHLANTTAQLGDLSSAALATKEYSANVHTAANTLKEMNKSYADSMKAVSAMTDATKDSGEYHKQMQAITKNLQALNSVYEMELKDADSHVKNMNKFYESLSGAMSGLSKVGDNTTKFTSELSKLTDNLSALNNVYGSMLTAMKGGK